jgi:3-dehydroquinate dehydratase/shikimate dehydrogenase
LKRRFFFDGHDFLMSSALLCETVTGQTLAELTRARDAATSADLVELRLDGITDLDVAGALAGRHSPVIATCRPAWEGGRFDGSEEERRRILESALDLGADYVDIEWKASFDALVARHPGRVVLSSHDFSGVPTDLTARARAMRGTGAAVIKLAVTTSRLADTLPLIPIARDGGAVVVGMGDAGVPTRLLASRFGSRWTYAGNAVAPGQLPLARMRDEFRFRSIGPSTALYGVVGNNVMHSLSPAMHNAAFAAAGLDAVFVPLLAADFDDFLAFADALGIVGASITVPYKMDALRAAASADDLTRTVGAANTLRRRDRRWEATNTDVGGFLEPLDRLQADLKVRFYDRRRDDRRRHADYPAARFAVLGTGGAARAVVLALRARGAQVSVHGRNPEHVESIAGALGVKAGPWPPAPGSWDVLVNTTPLGSPKLPGQSPLPDGPFDGRLVYDLTYGKEQPPLLRDARAAGLATLDGLPMLIAQAERQFEWWTGQRPAPRVMENNARHHV